MPIINRIADFYDDMKQWRQELHADPELKFEYRKEILLSIKYVDRVISSPWLIKENFLKIFI